MGKNKFEEDLKVYFPDIYKLHQYGKFDRLIWEVADALIEMADGNVFGEVKITYQSGKINHIYQTKNRSHTTKPHLSDAPDT